MRESFLVFGQPLIQEEEIAEVIDSMRKSWLGTGPKVSEFEKLFAAYKNIDHVAAVNSCTAALHLSCAVLGLKKGDEVITTAMTFCATINAIIHSGATPVLADIDPISWNISPGDIEKRITSKTKAILAVHFAGRCCDMDSIMAIARKHNLAVIEDCAHAIESEYKGLKAGTIGDFGCFSFYATKNITTGEGGMVISKHKNKIDDIKIMALHGLSADAWKRFSDAGHKHYYVTRCGYKYNMMDLQAAMGMHQLKKIGVFRKRRECIWNKYIESFKDLGIGLPAEVEAETKHAYHLFNIRINPDTTVINRDQFLEKMVASKLGVGVQYLSIPEHPYYQNAFGWNPTDYPHALKHGQETVSLPLSAKLTDQDIDDVISTVKNISAGN